MADGSGPYYRLRPGFELVRLEGGEALLASDSTEIELGGPVFPLLAEHALLELDGTRPWREVVAMAPQVDAGAVRAHLDELVRAGALLRADAPLAAAMRNPLADLLDAQDGTGEAVARRLAHRRVAIFGLAGHGAHLAALLHRCGIGALLLVDPYPLREGDRALLPPVPAASIGRPRHDVVRDLLAASGAGGELVVSHADAVREEVVRGVARDADLLVCAFDHELGSTNFWVNRAALEFRVPALFGALRGSRATAGPLVVPGETACYLCWRMRRLACADDVAAAMARERRRDARREPAPAPAPAWPPLVSWLAERLATQVISRLGETGPCSLRGRVETHDPRRLATESEPILTRADCPACGGHSRTAAVAPGAGILGMEEVVGSSFGWVRSMTRLVKDPSEPERPFVFQAELANHRFRGAGQKAFLSCAGKGMTIDEARASTLGEAAERYAGMQPGALPVTRATRDALDGPALDPRRLVLFHSAQYEHLPYDPYDDGAVVAWVRGRTLGGGEELHVPAVAVLLEHQIEDGEAHLCAMTSNGLAAGAGLDEAMLSGLYEVLERDALLTTWLLRLPVRRVDPRTHPDPQVVELCRAYERRGVAMELYLLPTDHPAHVFLALAVEPTADPGPVVVVGAGAHLDPAPAARAALLEAAQVRPSLRIHVRDAGVQERMRTLVADVHAVQKIDDHHLRYAAPGTLGSFAFLREHESEPFSWEPTAGDPGARVGSALPRLVEHLAGQGREPIGFDLTTPDLARFGVHVARVVVPDLQPLHFGRDERRLGGARLTTLPRELGLRPDAAAPEDLNDDPHPLA